MADRPAPYDHPSLSTLALDKDLLVPISSIEQDGSLPVGDVVCQATQTKQSLNSMYWVMWQLKEMEGCNLKVRLDPLLICPASEYIQTIYLMNVYGVPLDWKRLAR